jgi:hypothetical protein
MVCSPGEVCWDNAHVMWRRCCVDTQLQSITHTHLSPGSHGTGDFPRGQTDAGAVDGSSCCCMLHTAAAGEVRAGFRGSTPNTLRGGWWRGLGRGVRTTWQQQGLSLLRAHTQPAQGSAGHSGPFRATWYFQPTLLTHPPRLSKRKPCSSLACQPKERCTHT